MRTSLVRFSVLAGGLTTFALAACGSSAAGVYDNEDGRAVVVGDGKGGTAALMPSGGCLAIGEVKAADGSCVKPQDKCGVTGRADVVVGSDGQVIEIVCYPSVGQDAQTVSGAAVDGVSLGNKSALLLDGVADGADVTGDVVISGNNSYIFGQGAAVSVIGGSVRVDKNNAGVRGVRVQGNFEVSKNNAVLILSVIEGDVVLDGNNAILAETTVLGNVVVRGNNAQLIGNRIKGNIQIEGNNTVCDGNFAFTDANDDKTAQSTEKGAALTCAAR